VDKVFFSTIKTLLLTIFIKGRIAFLMRLTYYLSIFFLIYIKIDMLLLFFLKMIIWREETTH